MSEVKFEIVEEITKLAETSGGYTLAVNMVSWNDAEPKVDIRRWDPNGNPKKGIALTREQAIMMAETILEKANY